MTRRTALQAAMLSMVVAVGILIDARPAAAQGITEGHIDYSVGAIGVIETPRQVLLFKDHQLLLTSTIKPGGLLDPAIHGDERGFLVVGRHRFDLQTGQELRAEETSQNRQCRWLPTPSSKTLLATRGTHALALFAQLDESGLAYAYDTRLVDLAQCRVLSRTTIATEDTDVFFEYRTATSGWWLIGSHDSTLLVSNTGRQWTHLTPPQNIQNVLTADWRADGSFWILANKIEGTTLIPTLFKSVNLGQTWQEIETKPTSVPTYWFEAIRTLAADKGS